MTAISGEASVELAVATADELPAINRYELFLFAARDAGQAWGLASKRGRWALSADGPHDVLPLWPSSSTAKACALDNWAGMHPAPIRLEELADEWLPELEAKGDLVLIYLTRTADGAVVSPRALRDDLSAVGRLCGSALRP